MGKRLNFWKVNKVGREAQFFFSVNIFNIFFSKIGKEDVTVFPIFFH